MRLDQPVTALKGIGAKRAELFKKLEIETVGELLAHLPYRYDDMRNTVDIGKAEEGQTVLIRAQVAAQPRWIKRAGRFSVFSFTVSDGTGSMGISVFNMPFTMKQFAKGRSFCFYGKIKLYQASLHMDNPRVFDGEAQLGVEPVYRLTGGLTNRAMRAAIGEALKEAECPDFYSQAFLHQAGLREDIEDFHSVHAPASLEEAEAGKLSLAKKEILLFLRMVGLADREAVPIEPMRLEGEWRTGFLQSLPFQPTGDQRRAMDDIFADMAKDRPMNRLLQGDVGSGKTVVAMFAAYLAMMAGGQAAIMAPTELLAAQHYEQAKGIFGSRVALLTGSTSTVERRRIFDRILVGSVSVLIGTHALIYAHLEFENLRLIVTDEQHRFGVAQRAALANGQEGVHTLVMSATPIPRTLALILFGKTKVSEIKELPPGRQPVKTYLAGIHNRGKMYQWVHDKVVLGDRAYVVCPLIEPAEEGGMGMPAVSLQSQLAKKFPDITVGLLHGKMPQDKKNEVMEAFKGGKIHILVSTTVIEVGVDVPEATIMVVENADRFGLAQLHQLRGRVGRGKGESFCYFTTDGSSGERLTVLKESADGFYIAEKDLEYRGGGDLIGQRQSGTMGLAISKLAGDSGLLAAAEGILGMMQEDFSQDYQRLTAAAQEKWKSMGEKVVLN